VFDEVAREPVEQLGMRGRVLGVHLVERHHQALAEQAIPEAVGDRLREEAAIGRVERCLDQFGSGADLGGGRGLVLLLGVVDLLLLGLLGVARKLVAAADLDLDSVQEQEPGLFLLNFTEP
jgi:hypothetical protein